MYNLVPFKSFKLKKKKAWRLLPLPLGLAWLAQKWPKIARRAVQKKGAFLESRAVTFFKRWSLEIIMYCLSIRSARCFLPISAKKVCKKGTLNRAGELPLNLFSQANFSHNNLVTARSLWLWRYAFLHYYSLAVLGGLLYYCKKKDARVENFCILYTTYVRVKAG